MVLRLMKTKGKRLQRVRPKYQQRKRQRQRKQ
jgi:hypothetical protein